MKLIDKSALVAEIVKMLQEEYPCDNSEQTTGYHYALYELQDFLDTLEVKEVDLEKEICKALIDLKSKDSMRDWFTHFFSLGLRASNPLTWEDIRDILKIYEEVTDMDSCEDIYGETLKRFKERRVSYGRVW